MGESVRVALVLGTTSGGTGRHVRMLAGGLVERGHRVVVIGPGSTEEAFDFTGAGARFAAVPVSDRPHPANDLRAVAAIRRYTRDADVVHAHGLRAGALAALALAGRRGPTAGTAGLEPGPAGESPGGDKPGDAEAAVVALDGAAMGASGRSREDQRARGNEGARAGRPKLVVTLHNALTASGMVGAIYGVLERIVARRADVVLGVSRDLSERMAALGAREVGPAVVPAPPLRPVSREPEEVRAELGAGERPIVLSNIRLAQQKGLDLLLETAEGPWAEPVPLFVVAGDGPLRAGLQRRIDAHGLPVKLLGWRQDVPDLLAAATLALWPSRWEGQPLSMSEALKAGVPIVATEVGGIPDLLAGAGLLVPYGDAKAMRAAVQEALGRREELARRAAERGRRLPDERAAIDAILTVYPVRGR